MKLLPIKARSLLAALGLLLLALLIWRGGPYLAFDEVYPLQSANARLATIGAVVALRVAWALAKRLRGARATDRFVSGVTRPPEADRSRPTDDVLQLRDRFEEAVATLRKRRRGSRSLYELPWYVFIGAPGSGKTTALVNSGLKFPLEQRIGKGAVRGVGGTRNCDWWFTDDAVFLDTAGRYTSQDSDTAADSAAWAAFLALLRQYRKRRPLNGVILTVSVQDLMTLAPDGRAAQVTAARRRLDELRRELRVQLPVYVMVTKCDLVAGFAEYFDDQTADGRAQVWGVTFPYEQTAKGTAVQAFPAEFDALMLRLNERLFDRLEDERDARRRTRILGFPQQMAALRGLLDEFVAEVFGSTLFDQRILLRGVYFTSGTQEGTPIDRLLSAIGRRFALAPDVVLPPPGRGKAYFIERFLKDVILAESGVAGVNWRQELKLGAVQLGLYAAIAVLVVTAVIFMSVSYRRNSEYLRDMAQVVTGLDRTPPVVAGAPLDVVLPRLKAVRAVADAANRYRVHTPWAMRWGLFQGRSVGTAARDAYARELDGGLLPHFADRIARSMRTYAGDPDLVYEYLKGYLMLGDRKHLDKNHLKELAKVVWQSESSPETATAVLGHFDRLLAEDVVLREIPPDASLVAQARATIHRASIPRLIYNRMKLAHAEDGPGLRLDAALNADKVLRRRSGRKLSEPVPYLFTKTGFDAVTAGGADSLVTQFEADSWVWGEAGVSLADSQRLGAAAIDCYETEYIATWEDIVRDVECMSFAVTGDNLAILSGPTSPLRGFMQTVDENTYLVKPPEQPSSGVVATTTRQVLDKVLPSRKAGTAVKTVPGARVTAHFSYIHQTMAGGQGNAPIDRVLALMAAVRQPLLAAGSGPGQTKALDFVADPQLNAQITALKQEAATLPPVVGGIVSQIAGRTKAAVSTGATSDLLNRYQQEVQRECKVIIEGRYPFVPSSTEVPLDDFARLFGYDGIFDAFFKANLEKLVDRSHTPWTFLAGSVSASPEMLRQFEAAEHVRRMFFEPGSKTPLVAFTLAPVDIGPNKFRLRINGKPYEYKRGTTQSQKATWPGDGPSQVVATFEAGLLTKLVDRPVSKTFDGPWAWFRFIDFAAPHQESELRATLNIVFEGHSARMRLEASRIDNPFTNRRWQQFRCAF